MRLKVWQVSGEAVAPSVASWTSDDAACPGQSLICAPREAMDESKLENAVNSDDEAKNGIQKKLRWWRRTSYGVND